MGWFMLVLRYAEGHYKATTRQGQGRGEGKQRHLLDQGKVHSRQDPHTPYQNDDSGCYGFGGQVGFVGDPIYRGYWVLWLWGSNGALGRPLRARPTSHKSRKYPNIAYLALLYIDMAWGVYFTISVQAPKYAVYTPSHSYHDCHSYRKS